MIMDCRRMMTRSQTFYIPNPYPNPKNNENLCSLSNAKSQSQDTQI